jgi:hypothetical protein
LAGLLQVSGNQGGHILLLRWYDARPGGNRQGMDENFAALSGLLPMLNADCRVLIASCTMPA